MKPIIKIKNLSKSYLGNKVLNNINFEVYDSEILVIMGASGAGKSTLLNIIGQLDHDYEGEIEYDDRIFEDVIIPFPFVFQEFESLLPWKTVVENIKLVRADIGADRLEKILNIVELQAHQQKKPSELSGGMKQRVALAQALACESKVLLMDEPFGSLDTQLRKKLQDFLVELKKTQNFSIIFVTHDLEEANRIADRIINI